MLPTEHTALELAFINPAVLELVLPVPLEQTVDPLAFVDAVVGVSGRAAPVWHARLEFD